MKTNTKNGFAWCYGDNINTDLIYPGRYLAITSPLEMAKNAMADVDPKFGKNVQTGDIIIAGSNFGCGSSREQAVMCLKFAGIAAIIAESFARIFYRNAINQGLPAIISSKASSAVKTGDRIELDIHSGVLMNLNTGKKISFEPVPEFLLEIVNHGGIIPHLKKRFDLD